MKTLSANQAKVHFGRFLEAAQRGPLTITKNGRPAAVLLSVADYDRIRGENRQRLLATIAQAQRDAEWRGPEAEGGQ